MPLLDTSDALGASDSESILTSLMRSHSATARRRPREGSLCATVSGTVFL
jgi:hypothetical protein